METVTVTNQWTDSEGNLFLESKVDLEDPDYIYSLVKIHADNQTLESTMSEVDYPTEIDPTGWYAIYYRQ